MNWKRGYRIIPWVLSVIVFWGWASVGVISFISGIPDWWVLSFPAFVSIAGIWIVYWVICKPPKRVTDVKLNETTAIAYILGCILLLVFVWASENFSENFKKDKNDKYEIKDGKVYFTEAKYVFGSIFNKSTLVLTDDNIEIFNHSFFGEKKTVRPYSSLKKITFSSAFVGYKVVIESQGGLLENKTSTFYFNQKDTFNFLKTAFKIYNENRCVITESL